MLGARGADAGEAESGKGALPTPPDMPVRIGRFNESGHPGSLQRSCLRLVICQSEFSFGILISPETPSLAQGTQTP
jgi:hypothetical protein